MRAAVIFVLFGAFDAHAADLNQRTDFRSLPPCSAGFVQQEQDGPYQYFRAHIPIACRVPGGVILTGPGQNPGCSGLPGARRGGSNHWS